MSKLTIQEIRRHPSVVTDPAELRPGLEIAVCSYEPPIGLAMRCGQAVFGLLAGSDKEGVSRIANMRQGYSFMPAWGIRVSEVATVNWVNTSNQMHRQPYASLNVTRSNRGLPLQEVLSNPVPSLADVPQCALALPPVEELNVRHEVMGSTELITGFDYLGLAAESNPHDFNRFVFKLSQ